MAPVLTNATESHTTYNTHTRCNSSSDAL